MWHNEVLIDTVDDSVELILKEMRMGDEAERNWIRGKGKWNKDKREGDL